MLTPFQQRGFAFKIETTEGVDSGPTSALNAIQLLDGSAMVESDVLERNLDRTAFGAKPATLTNKRAMIRGNIELIGNATPGNAAPISPVLRACGHGETLVGATSATYKPISSGIPSGSGRFWHAGELYSLSGARGRFDEITLNIDEYPRASIEIIGKAAAMAEAALPNDLDFSAFQIPPVIVAENSVMSIDGFNVDGKGLSIRPQVDLALIHHTEARIARHRDRRTEVTLRFFRSAYYDLNIHSLAEAETPVPVTFTVTTSAGANIAVTLPEVQLLLPRPVEIDGMLGWEVTGRCLPDIGDDEYSIAFT